MAVCREISAFFVKPCGLFASALDFSDNYPLKKQSQPPAYAKGIAAYPKKRGHPMESIGQAGIIPHC